MSSNEQPVNFESVKARLAQIADEVDDESLSLDKALDLYEEAVALGLQASDLLETGIVVPSDDALDDGASIGADSVDSRSADQAGASNAGVSAGTDVAGGLDASRRK